MKVIGFWTVGVLLVVAFASQSAQAEMQIYTEEFLRHPAPVRNKIKFVLNRTLSVEQQTAGYIAQRITTLKPNYSQKDHAFRIFESYQCRIQMVYAKVSLAMRNSVICEPFAHLEQFDGVNLKTVFSKELLELIAAYIDLVDPLVDQAELMAERYLEGKGSRVSYITKNQ